MSALTERPPESVTIDGVEYPIKTGFRNCLLSIEAIEDNALSEWEKADIVLKNHFDKPYPKDINAAVEQMILYFRQGKKTIDDGKPCLLDFEQDAQYIKDAFLSKGIDLNKSDMSFWEFMSHLRELPKDCMMNRIVYLRNQRSKGKLSKNERAAIRQIGEDIITIRNKSLDSDEMQAFYEFLTAE